MSKVDDSTGKHNPSGETRRQVVDTMKKAAFVAPATALLLAASSEMALPYGGGGRGDNGFGNGGGDGSPNGKPDGNR